ncbi:MAG: IS1595 family transposase, partial [Methylocella sp.]
MTTAKLQAPAFKYEAAAREAMEAVLWPHGPCCPRCGSLDKIGKVTGGTARPGLYYCGSCKRQFTVTVGTIFEKSKVALSKWWLAIHLMASSKKGVSAHQLHRLLNVAYPTAWFIEHRIREAMRTGSLAPMGGVGGIVEADETFIGRKEGSVRRRGHGHKNAVLSLIDRGSGQVRSFHVDGTGAADIVPIVKANVAKETAMMTDEGGHYFTLGDHFASHESVSHKADEYVRGDVHTNTVEGYYSVFKRGMKGVYQH